jgi:hypothetical protein
MALFTCVIISTILSFPLYTKQKRTEPTKGSARKIRSALIFRSRGAPHFPAAPHCAKTMALSFCLRDTAAFPAALHLRHPLYKRASPECTVFPRRARLFQFFRRTVVRDRKTIPYSVLVCKTFCISYAAFSSVMQTDEFCFGITFALPHHSAAINLFYFSFGSAPSNPRALPSGLASPFSFAVS